MKQSKQNLKKQDRLMSKKNWLLISLSILVVLAIAACGNGEEESEAANSDAESTVDIGEVQFPDLDVSDLDESVVAKYEGGEITGTELAHYLALQAFLNPQAPINEQEVREGYLHMMVLDNIVTADLEGQDISWSEQKADDFWEQISAVYDEDVREEGYEKLGITEAELKDYLLVFALRQQYFRDQITEEERTIASVRHILINNTDRTDEEALEIAEDLYNQLQEGADFAELAKEHTDDGGSQQTGGLYEDTSVSTWVPEFKQAALEQEINEIGEPVQTQFGYHIIRVESRNVVNLDEMSENEVGQITERKFAEFFTYTLPEYIIEINL